MKLSYADYLTEILKVQQTWLKHESNVERKLFNLFGTHVNCD